MVNELEEMSDELDDALREYLNAVFEDNNEVLTEYFVIAASRTLDNGGQTILVTKCGIPPYVVEGMLHRALRLINEL